MSERGILYIATGADFIQEATLSAKSVREQMPEIPIALIADQEPDSNDSGFEFDMVATVDDASHGFADQIQYLDETPFDRTLCLDTDIYADEPVGDVFDLLDEFDIAAAHNHDRAAYDVPGVPEAFPEYNTGVVAYRQSDEFSTFLDSWAEWYDHLSSEPDTRNQPSFRKALYHSGLRVGTLPPEYNCMTRYPGHAVGTVKLFHGRLMDVDTPGAGQYDDVPDIAAKVNSRKDHRVWTQLGGFSVTSNGEDRVHNKLRMGVYRYGVRGAIRRAIGKIV